jgi:hypothetical protein
MFKIKVIAVGAIVFFLLVGSAFFFIFPNVFEQSNNVKNTLEINNVLASWKTEKPFSITNYMFKGQDLLLIVKNNSGKELVLEKICVSEENCLVISEKLVNNSIISKLIGMSAECEKGTVFVLEKENIFFEYFENNEKKVQNAKTSIIGVCA